MKNLTYILVFLSVIFIASCNDSPFTAPGEEKPQPGGEQTFGLVEVTITGIGTDSMTAAAHSAAPNTAFNFTRPNGSGGANDGTIQLKAVTHGSFTYGTGGVRYIYAIFKVRNADVDGNPYSTALQNLTFLAVDTDASASVAETYGVTAISALRLFNGNPPANATQLAKEIIPTGIVEIDASGRLVSSYADVMQAFTEDEVQTFENTLPGGTDVNDIFHYGFIVRTPNVSPGSRMLPIATGTDDYSGVVTFAFKVPLQAQANQSPFEISVMFLPVEDSETRITQSIEEQNAEGQAALAAREAALNPEVVIIFTESVYNSPVAQLFCGPVRIAGAKGSPGIIPLFTPASHFTSFTPDPYSPGAGHITSPAAFTATFTDAISGADANTLVVNGQQSGLQFVGQSYTGAGTTAITTPTASFFPGEIVEMTATMELRICKPSVARYRVETTSGSGTFATAVPYGAGDEPAAITTGDFDGDGNLDLAIANFASLSVSVREGNGDGTFGPETTYAVGSGSRGITTGDFNEDGDLDLATANRYTSDVSVLLGNGDGTFAAGSSPNTGAYTAGITAGDFDGNGDLDLATANYNSDNISLLNGNGDGTFATDVLYGTSDGPISIISGDFDGDGDLDLATANYNSDIINVLEGNGDGTFEPVALFGTGKDPFSITAGDFDGDGDLDLATANFYYDNISLLEGNGDGTFATDVLYGTGDGPKAVIAGDFNGDGDLDLATANSISDNISVLEGNGDGTFGAAATYGAGDEPKGIIAGDFDGDGALDLAVANRSSDNISVLLNQ